MYASIADRKYPGLSSGRLYLSTKAPLTFLFLGFEETIYIK